MVIKIIREAGEAKATVLKRTPLEEIRVSAQMAEGIRQVFGQALTPEEAVAWIINDVRQKGDKALLDYTQRIEGVALKSLKVSQDEMEKAWQETPQALRQALELAAERIRRFHQQGRMKSWLEWREGSALGQIVHPLERVGVYVPGGTAPYPSSLLMAAIPAQVAGVSQVVATSPPDREGCLPPAVLAAARIAGVDAVFKVGGAQAIAALAYGTESVPKVDKIVGPGNLFVVLAKRQVFGSVAIDGLPGPTETLLVADETARPAYVAADLLAQAEHDALATALLITPSLKLALAVQSELERQLAALSRREIAARSLEERGAIVVVRDLNEAIDLANYYAPEHLCLLVADPWSLVGKVRNAGGVFLGEVSSEALGDYVAGPSHIMPTGGTARFASPLNVNDFLKITSVFALAGEEMREIAPAAVEIARAEGLTAHAAAVRMRNEDAPEQGVRGGSPQSISFPICEQEKDEQGNPFNNLRMIEELLRPDVFEMEEYTPIVPFEVLSARLGLPAERIIKLDANENPYGPSPKALAALANHQGYHIYPDPDHTLLREAIQSYTGVDKDRILCGNGADELIDLVMRLVLRPGDGVIDCPPTFGMYTFVTSVCRGQVVQVPRCEDFSLNVEGIEKAVQKPAKIKLIFLPSPNNPDGSLIPIDDLKRVLELPLIAVLDEAYVEFSGQSLAGMVLEYPNLIVLRTFSKWAGLAGLRIGYGLFPESIIRHLWKIKPPYNVNVAAQAAALASLEDIQYLQSNVRRIVEERERLYRALQGVSFLRPYPSQANFILCRVLDRDARGLKLALEREGILVRYFSKPGLMDCIRVSVGRPEHTDALLERLYELE